MCRGTGITISPTKHTLPSGDIEDLADAVGRFDVARELNPGIGCGVGGGVVRHSRNCDRALRGLSAAMGNGRGSILDHRTPSGVPVGGMSVPFINAHFGESGSPAARLQGITP